MNSSNERKSNIPGEERDENASLEKLDTEKVKEDDTLDKDDENESRSNTPESEKETEKDVDLNTVRQTMQRLWETNDFLKESYQLDLKLIHNALTRSDLEKSNVVEATEVVIDLGLISLFGDIYAKCFSLDWSGKYSSQSLTNMRLISGTVLSATDRSAAACEQLVDVGLPRVILDYLNNEKLSPDRLTASGIQHFIDPLLTILYNVVQKCDAARKAYRDASAVEILSQFRSIEDADTKCVVAFTLAYIVAESKSENLLEDDDTIPYAVKHLRQCCDAEDHRSTTGFRTGELLEGLNNLAKNDSNKERIVRVGALPLYTKLLTIGNEQEKYLACEGLWRLASRCRDFINRETGCVDALRKLATCGEPEVSKEAKGALVRLEVTSHGAADVGKTGNNDGNEPDHRVKPVSKMPLRSTEDAEDVDNSSSQTSGKQKGEDVYLNIIRQTMHRLRETTIYATKNCHRDIKLIANAMKPKSSRRIDIAITDTVVELGLVRLFADICRNSFYLDWCGTDGAQALTTMHLMAHIMLIATDRSDDLCIQVVDTGLAGDILKYLNDPKVHPDMLSAKGVETVVSRLLGILHNVVQKCEPARKAYREASAIDVLSKFLSVQDIETTRIVTLTLACVTSEAESCLKK